MLDTRSGDRRDLRAIRQWNGIVDGLTRASIFPGFLATIVLLRATADQRPEIAAARRMFSALDPARRDSGIVIGTHMIGFIIQVGVFAILAPILGRDAAAEERREVFTAAIRGMSVVPLWSPFTVGMAVASQYLPLVPLWLIMSLGLSMAIICFTVSYFGFDRNRGFQPLMLAMRSLVPVVIPILIAAAAVVATTMVTSLSTLQALIIAPANPLPACDTAGANRKYPAGLAANSRRVFTGRGPRPRLSASPRSSASSSRHPLPIPALSDGWKTRIWRPP